MTCHANAFQRERAEAAEIARFLGGRYRGKYAYLQLESRKRVVDHSVEE